MVLADGTVFEGVAFGAPVTAVGEVCFNTAMTGYQEILADPSYAGQIIAFTFPHIGIVGTNEEDIESINPSVRGVVVRAYSANPSNYRALTSVDRWLNRHQIPGISGIDTRRLTAQIRENGMPHGVIAHDSAGGFDIRELRDRARSFPGLEGLDLAKEVTCRQMFTWDQTPWVWDRGYGRQTSPVWRAVVVDYGVKRNILRLLAGSAAEITVVPAEIHRRGRFAAPPARGPAVERSGRSRGHRHLRNSDDPESDRVRHSDFRHLSRPSDARTRPGRTDPEDGSRPSWGQSPRQRSGDWKSRDRLHKSWVHG